MSAVARPAVLAPLLLAAVLAGGCTVGPDDEMAPAPRSSASAPPDQPTTAAAAPVPGRVPVGAADLDPAAPVWAQGSVLHVGDEAVDVSPRRVDALVATRGGIYFLDEQEVWFTDLALVRATGLTGVAELAVDADRAAIRVTWRGTAGAQEVRGYATGDGSAVPARSVRPATVEQRLGRADRLELRTERSDVSSTAGPVDVRLGRGKYGLVDDDGGPLVAFDTTYDLRRPLTGVVGTGFELVAWTSPTTFYGLALKSGRPAAVLGCDLTAGSCRTWGTVDAGASLLFEAGT